MWHEIKARWGVWRVGALPGLVILGLVFIIRLAGILQFQEWLMFDSFLRLRPPEPIEQRITIIGIDEEDIDREGYPIPDKELAALLRTLQQYQPRVVGLDLAKNRASSELVEAIKENQNQIAVEKVIPDRIAPPPGLPAQQIGFIDAITDEDSRLRRVLLGTSCDNCTEYKLSLVVRLAEAYLAPEGITLENGILDPKTMRFGSAEIPRFFRNTGGYVGVEAGGIQTLINFRSGTRFPRLSLGDIKTGNVERSWISDRIVIIGMTAPSVQDIKNTSAIASEDFPAGQVYGVEIIAHAVSQIISASLDGRPLIKTWTEVGEYLWILVWGLAGIVLAWLPLSPPYKLLGVGLTTIVLLLFCYLMLSWWGWWLPIVPATIVLILNGLVLTSFYENDRALRFRLQERQLTIDSTYDGIHNGPLQTLKMLIRKTRDREISLGRSLTELERLDREMREVYESLYRETSNPISTHRSLSGLNLNMQQPLHELLEQVYRHTIERDFPCFATLRVIVPQIEPMEDRYLTVEQKRGLCRVLEEALCNVGKYATGATRLKITCKQESNLSILRVEDNGVGISSTAEGRGTKQAKNLARKLRGKFERRAKSPKGTVSELTWQSKKRWWNR